MGDMADYYDQRDDSREYLYDLLFSKKVNNKRDTIVESKRNIYQSKLIDGGLSIDDRRQLMINTYNKNSNSKVGESCKCPSCDNEFIKVSYQQKFCKSKTNGKSNCKDYYHNFTNPSRLERYSIRND